jgi:UDP-N-acetylglucosamine--N-acetylmuramyl-(pentapeptide) pyrophosphoryl-undecaprenol N-acetylglucosamine transferase
LRERQSSKQQSGGMRTVMRVVKPVDQVDSCASLRVLMAAGGTGGHIFPALAVARELQARANERRDPEGKEPGCVIEFVGSGRELEKRTISQAGFPLHTVAAAGLKGLGGLRKMRNFLVLPRSFWDTGKLLREFRPHVVAGVGGYIAGPVMLEAALCRIPTLLIEPNAVPGFTNRVLARFIDRAALGFEEARSFYGERARLTGHPVRSDFYRIASRCPAPPFCILILGGSQGSRAMNDAMVSAIPRFARKRERFRIIHQTGERDFDRVRQAYERQPIKAEVYAFIEDVPRALEQADLVISRAGASTVAELAAAGKPALLIPFPHATDQHQLANARAMERAGGAKVLVQRELTPGSLYEEVAAAVNDPEKLMEMGRRARLLAHPQAAARIANLIEELAQGAKHRV